jgi:Copper type II ascorbate-dependent monooxygenase, C-terminal domain
MPGDAAPLHVWAVGGGALVLPDDVELVVPEQTTSMIVQAHVLRLGDGPATERRLTVTTRSGALHRAGWLPLRAPVPALRPQHREESAATCAIASDLHIISTWPHMHQAGAEFRGSVIAGEGPRTYVDVDPWQYDAQQAYDVDVLVAGAASIETRCIWQNDTDQTILPGPLVTNEMCGQSLMGWPVEAAHCE